MRRERRVIRTEERPVSIYRSSHTSVDGVVRVRHFGADGTNWRFSFEQQQPVAIRVRRRGASETLALPGDPLRGMLFAALALPIAARVAVMLFSHRRRRDT
jgi:hypothetical protein